MGIDNCICNCSGFFVSLAGVEDKKKKKRDGNSSDWFLCTACWNSLSCNLISTQDKTRKKTQTLHLCTNRKKEGENQEWQTNDSSQYSLVQCRQDLRASFNHQVQSAPPTCFPTWRCLLICYYISSRTEQTMHMYLHKYTRNSLPITFASLIFWNIGQYYQVSNQMYQ